MAKDYEKSERVEPVGMMWALAALFAFGIVVWMWFLLDGLFAQAQSAAASTRTATAAAATTTTAVPALSACDLWHAVAWPEYKTETERTAAENGETAGPVLRLTDGQPFTADNTRGCAGLVAPYYTDPTFDHNTWTNRPKAEQLGFLVVCANPAGGHGWSAAETLRQAYEDCEPAGP